MASANFSLTHHHYSSSSYEFNRQTPRIPTLNLTGAVLDSLACWPVAPFTAREFPIIHCLFPTQKNHRPTHARTHTRQDRNTPAVSLTHGPHKTSFASDAILVARGISCRFHSDCHTRACVMPYSVSPSMKTHTQTRAHTV